MAEVGVLQLTIEDNSESAAKGLGRLADVLERVRNAVGSGLGLEGTSNEIEKIAKVVNDAISGSTIIKLGQFADALKGLKDVDLSGVSKVIKSVGKESGNPGKQISESLVAGIEEGMSKVDLLREKVGILRGEMDEGIDKETFDDKRIVNYALQIANLEEQIGRLEEVERRAGDAEQWTKFSEEFSTIDAYAMKLSALREKLIEGINSGKWDNEKIANAVLKIQSLEERIEKLKELQSEGVLKTTNEEAIQAANNFLSASTNIDLLKQKLYAMKAEMGQGILSGAWDEKKLSSYAIQVQNLEEKIRKLSAAAEEAKPNLDGVTEVTGDPGSAFNEVKESVEGAAGSTGALSDGMTDVSASVEEAAGTSQRFAGALNEVQNESETASNSLKETRSAVSMLKSGFEKMFPTLSTFLSGMGRIAKYRLLRTIIRQITSGMSEGIQNVYHYSKAIGSSFAPAMDDAATALLQMKNSIGAALAPMIQSLIPYLQIVVNWFIEAVNWVNQFVSLLRGQSTWTRAVPKTTQAFDDQTKAAKKTGAAIKDMLADWDELNIIQSQNGGSAGSTAAQDVVDYANMFEEVFGFDKDIKETVDYIKDHFEEIVRLAQAALVLIAAWKVSNAFGETLSGLKTIIAGVALVITGFTLSSEAGKSAGLKGYWSGEDAKMLLGGMIASALGGMLIGMTLGGFFGGAAGFVIGMGISLVAMITSYNAAEDLKDKKDKWGNSDYTPEQIHEFIQSQFTFDIEARIKSMKLVYEDAAKQKQTLENSINLFTRNLNLAKIKVSLAADGAPAALEALNNSANDVINQFNAWSDKNMEFIQASIKLVPLTDSEGNIITKDFVDNLMVGNEKLQTYMYNIGKDIADAYNKGIKENWGKGTEEAYLEQIERLNKIIADKDAYVRGEKNKNAQQVIWENMSYDNAKQSLEDMQKWEDDYIEETKNVLQQRYQANLETAGYWSSIMNDLKDQYEKGKIEEADYLAQMEEAKKYYDIAAEAAAGDFKALQNVRAWLLTDGNDDLFKESVERFRQKWIEILQNTEGNGYDIAKGIKSSAQAEYILGTYRNEYAMGARDITSVAHDIVHDLFNPNFWNYPESDLSKGIREANGIKGSELMTSADRRELIKYLRDEGFTEDLVREIINIWDISVPSKEEFLKIIEEEFPKQTPFEVNTFGDMFKFFSATSAEDYFNEAMEFLDLPGVFDDLIAFIDPLHLLMTDMNKINESKEKEVYVELDLNQDALRENLRKDILKALENDDIIDDIERTMMLMKYKEDMYYEVLDEVNDEMDSASMTRLQRLASTGNLERTEGGMGVSDVGWNPSGLEFEAEMDNGDTDAQMQTNIESGAKRGTQDMLGVLRDLLNVAQAINRKEFRVTITPTSTLGATMSKSMEKYGMVTGEN